ncbi:MAG: hypothetical protein GY862_14625 [Gammaproteobacteria bacterium]|nr:hypothetical protein [Gammaproteobacteria bacterium]
MPALCTARPGYALRAASLHLSRAAGCRVPHGAPKPVINDARLKVMGFGAGKTMPKTTIGARLYPSYRNQATLALPVPWHPGPNNVPVKG